MKRRRPIGRTVVLAVVLVAASLIAAQFASLGVKEPDRLAADLTVPTATTTVTTVTTDTTVSSTSSSTAAVTVTVRRRASPPSATRPSPPRRASLPSSSGGVARAVWDIPGSGFQRGDPVVALTFDDGPDPRWTPQILDVLARYRVPATFFAVGRMASAHRDLVRRVAAAGHGVANHTWNHVDLRTTANYAHEVDDTSRLLAELTGRDIGCIRPPKGAINAATTARLRDRGLTTVLWDVDTADYTRPGSNAIANRVLSAVRPGSIILLHDGGGDRSQTLAALPQIIEGLQARGLRPVATCNAPPPPPTTTATTQPEPTTPAPPESSPTPEPDPTTTTAPEPTTTSAPEPEPTTTAPPESTTTSPSTTTT